MQSYTREFNGKNQFWTPSNLGFTNSLIDNKLNNLSSNITYNHSFIYQTDDKDLEGNIYINGIKANLYKQRDALQPSFSGLELSSSSSSSSSASIININ